MFAKEKYIMGTKYTYKTTLRFREDLSDVLQTSNRDAVAEMVINCLGDHVSVFEATRVGDTGKIITGPVKIRFRKIDEYEVLFIGAYVIIQ